MTQGHVPRNVLLRLAATVVVAGTLACSDRATPTGQRDPGGIRAVVTPIYDENGQPASNYYSANSQITWTTDSSFEPPGAQFTRSYFEEYDWSSTYGTWDNHNSYGAGDLPFDSDPPPEIDVASARMTFGVTAPDIRDRSGAAVQLPSSRPPLQSDTSALAPIQLPYSGPPPGSAPASSAPRQPALLQAAVAAPNSGFSPVERRAAALERMVVTPQITLKVLERLRAAFTQSPGPGGTVLFTQLRGGTEVKVTFDPALGGVTMMATSEGGRLLSQTVYRYAPVPLEGALVLAEAKTTLFRPDGTPGRTFTQTYDNVTVR
jgi:hypothetical protein